MNESSINILNELNQKTKNKTPLDVLKNYYVGKTLVDLSFAEIGDVRMHHYGKKIVDVYFGIHEIEVFEDAILTFNLTEQDGYGDYYVEIYDDEDVEVK